MRHIKHFKHILLILPILAVSMMILYGTPAYANTYLENTDDITVTENNSYTIINGVTEGDLTLTKSGGSTAKAHVVLVKANAKAKFKAATPGYYSAGSTKTSRAAKAEAWTDSDWQVKSLTKKQLQDVFTAKVTNWKDVGGPDALIAAWQRKEGSGRKGD